jgi:hypothetical protein
MEKTPSVCFQQHLGKAAGIFNPPFFAPISDRDDLNGLISMTWIFGMA